MRPPPKKGEGIARGGGGGGAKGAAGGGRSGRARSRSPQVDEAGGKDE